MAVQRSIVIHRSIATTENFVANLESQRHFNYYNLSQKNLQFQADKGQGKPGSTATWKLPEGNISATLTWLELKNHRIDFSLQILYGFGIFLVGHCEFIQLGVNSTKVQCEISARQPRYKLVALPDFKANNNQDDVFADTLLNLKLFLEKPASGR